MITQFIVYAIFISLVIPLIFIDYYHYILPNVITIPGMVLGLALSPLHPYDFSYDLLTMSLYDLLNVHRSSPELDALVGSLLGIIIGGGTLWFVAKVYYHLRKVEGLGFGDVKMMAMVGAFLGWKLAWFTIFLGSFVGSLYGLYLIAAKGKGFRHELYFGTFLGLGALIALFYGSRLLNLYFHFRV